MDWGQRPKPPRVDLQSPKADANPRGAPIGRWCFGMSWKLQSALTVVVALALAVLGVGLVWAVLTPEQAAQLKVLEDLGFKHVPTRGPRCLGLLAHMSSEANSPRRGIVKGLIQQVREKLKSKERRSTASGKPPMSPYSVTMQLFIKHCEEHIQGYQKPSFLTT